VLFTNHVLAGGILGALIGRPVPAFVVGVASHPAMDSLPHFGMLEDDEFLPVARVDGLTAIGVGATLAALARSRRVPVAAGMFGAALLDLEKPMQHFFSRSVIPRVVEDWHIAIQWESRQWLAIDLTVGATLAVAATTLLRRRARRERG
jgi:hypothetical protein